MKNDYRVISPFTIAFILIGAVFGAAFASGQEVLKFFCAYGKWGMAGLALCLVLYMSFGYMTYELARIRNTGRMEEIITPTDNTLIQKAVSVIMMFCFAVILIALIAAGDSLFTAQFGFGKGIGGLIITLLVVLTNLFGFDGIKKIMPIVIPVMLVIMLSISITIIVSSDSANTVHPGQFMSPLAPNWIIGALLYVSYNFLVTIPTISSLPGNDKARKKVVVGLLIGFVCTCIFGLLLYLALMTDLDAAGTHDLPMTYLSAKISPVLCLAYSMIMVIAIYSASSNCLYGLTKNISNENRKKKVIIVGITGAAAYLISLVGFSQLVTYAYPVQGYACILIMISILITYFKYGRKKER